jgi:hypothetical protein
MALVQAVPSEVKKPPVVPPELMEQMMATPEQEQDMTELESLFLRLGFPKKVINHVMVYLQSVLEDAPFTINDAAHDAYAAAAVLSVYTTMSKMEDIPIFVLEQLPTDRSIWAVMATIDNVSTAVVLVADEPHTIWYPNIGQGFPLDLCMNAFLQWEEAMEEELYGPEE